MSAAANPARLSAAFDDDAAYAAEITAAMRVPKRLQVTGEPADGPDRSPPLAAAAFGNGPAPRMSVPDRIVVLGGERHGAGGGAPRELLLERAAQPPPAPAWRSPPRVLRVEDHLLPAAERPADAPGERGRAERGLALREPSSPPALPDFLTPPEEIELLRRQLLKVNRRLMLIEVENQRRRSREVMLYTAGFAYLVVRAVLWMSRM